MVRVGLIEKAILETKLVGYEEVSSTDSGEEHSSRESKQYKGLR